MKTIEFHVILQYFDVFFIYQTFACWMPPLSLSSSSLLLDIGIDGKYWNQIDWRRKMQYEKCKQNPETIFFISNSLKIVIDILHKLTDIFMREI